MAEDVQENTNDRIDNWWDLLEFGIKKSWPWGLATLIVGVPLIFGDLRGYIAVADYVSTHQWTVYLLLALPLVCIVLLGTVKAFGDRIISLYASMKDATQPFYKRRKMHAYRKISLDGLVVSSNSVELEAITDTPVSSVRHRRTVVGGAGEFIDSEIEFTPERIDGGGRMMERVLSQTPSVISWEVVFTPPLQRGQTALYSYKQRVKGAFALTTEEINAQLASGHRTDSNEQWRLRVTVPTDELFMKMEFPPNYPITFPHSGGYSVYLDRSEDPHEAARLKVEKCFRASLNPIDQSWTLELSVRRPQVGLSYALEWIPPSAKDFPSVSIS